MLIGRVLMLVGVYSINIIRKIYQEIVCE